MEGLLGEGLAAVSHVPDSRRVQCRTDSQQVAGIEPSIPGHAGWTPLAMVLAAELRPPSSYGSSEGSHDPDLAAHSLFHARVRPRTRVNRIRGDESACVVSEALLVSSTVPSSRT